jgi:hypothetical protein
MADQLAQLQPPEYTSWLDNALPSFVQKFGDEQAVSMAEKYYHKQFLLPIEIYNAGFQAARAAALSRATLQGSEVAAPGAPAAPAFQFDPDVLQGLGSVEAIVAAVSARPAEPARPPAAAASTVAAPAAPSSVAVPRPSSTADVTDSSWSDNDWQWNDGWGGSSQSSGTRDAQWQQSSSGWSEDGWRAKKQKKELPTDPEEYKKFALAKAVDWYTARNRTGWLNKSAPLVYHLLKETDADYEVALKIAAEYSDEKLMESMIRLYGKHLKE